MRSQDGGAECQQRGRCGNAVAVVEGGDDVIDDHEAVRTRQELEEDDAEEDDAALSRGRRHADAAEDGDDDVAETQVDKGQGRAGIQPFPGLRTPPQGRNFWPESTMDNEPLLSAGGMPMRAASQGRIQKSQTISSSFLV